MSERTAPLDRSGLFDDLGEARITENYRRTYGLGQEIGIAEVRAHAALEGALTDTLLRSTPENRRREFTLAYTRLYTELPWLNLQASGDAAAPADDGAGWNELLRPRSRIIEIGSGEGAMIRALADRGHTCFATEISDRRRENVGSIDGVEVRETDGVNLSNFEAPNSFDYVLSDQVFEHLHPDDHLTHMKEARKILKSGGRYILRTPHRSAGPCDLSQVFEIDQPVFMHLCEPTYEIMTALMRKAGFRRIYAVTTLPWRRGRERRHVASTLFLAYQRLFEKIEPALLPTQRQKRDFRKRFYRYARVDGSVWIAGEA